MNVGTSFGLDKQAETAFSRFFVQCMNVACLTLCLYDHACTFSSEISFIWMSRWTLPKILYILARFQPMAILPVGIYLLRVNCQIYLSYSVWTAYICIAIVEVIFALRTWTVWGCTRKILWFLVTFFFAMLFTAGIVLADMDRELGPHSSVYRTSMCTRSSAEVDPDIRGFLFQPFVTSALIVIFYFVIIVLCSWKAYQDKILLNTDSKLMRLVQFDGIFYYSCSLAVSTALLVCLPTDNALSGASYMIFILQLSLSSILACRMTLRLREYQSCEDEGLANTHFDTMRFEEREMDAYDEELHQ